MSKNDEKKYVTWVEVMIMLCSFEIGKFIASHIDKIFK